MEPHPDLLDENLQGWGQEVWTFENSPKDLDAARCGHIRVVAESRLGRPSSAFALSLGCSGLENWLNHTALVF